MRWTLGFLALFLLFYLGVRSERSGIWRDSISPAIRAVIDPVRHLFAGAPPAAPVIALRIDPVSYDSLAAIRQRAMLAGVLDEGKDDRFPVEVDWNGHTMHGRVRLKGDLADHFNTDKWSLRVQLDSGDVLGMTSFSLQHPLTRNFVHEWIFHHALARQGLPNLIYDFVEVRINDRGMGTYAIEQHFDAALLERIGLGGPVLKYDDGAWTTAMGEQQHRPYPADLPLQSEWLSSPIDAFHLDDALRDRDDSARLVAGARSLDAFRRGEAYTSQVFDQQRTARFFALCDALGAQHAHDWRNVRFATDTATHLLVPIGFDGNAGEAIPSLGILRDHLQISFEQTPLPGFRARLASDTTFLVNYVAWLDTFSTTGWRKAMLASMAGPLAGHVARLEAEFPVFDYDTLVFTSNASLIRSALHPRDAAIAYRLGEEGGRVRIAIANTQALPLYMLAVIVDADTIALDRSLMPRAGDGPLHYERITIDSASPSMGRMKVLLEVMGMHEPIAVMVKRWPGGVDPEQAE